MLKINCKKKLRECIEFAREHYDETLNKCLLRMVYYATRYEMVSISNDICAEHSFVFGCYDENGKMVFNGGIVFHGLPENGYKENNSVMIEPQYGWHIHT